MLNLIAVGIGASLSSALSLLVIIAAVILIFKLTGKILKLIYSIVLIAALIWLIVTVATSGLVALPLIGFLFA